MAKTPDELKDAMANLRESMTELTASVRGGNRDDVFAAVVEVARQLEEVHRVAAEVLRS